ncbi:MAG: hypothetical protein EHM61_04770 [Acidobacteria bacterium]|nr:MAG: hypothetical protein EHM61_04770 [Acidobacteriota bacterium]
MTEKQTRSPGETEPTGGTTTKLPPAWPEMDEEDSLDEYFRQLDEFTSGQSSSNCFDRLTEMGIELPLPQLLKDEEITAKIWEVAEGLKKLHVFLSSTNHLSDRELYAHLWNNSLRHETFICTLPDASCHLDVIGSGSEEDIETWLRYYADQEDRDLWSREWPDDPIPAHQDPPYDRDRFLPDCSCVSSQDGPRR